MISFARSPRRVLAGAAVLAAGLLGAVAVSAPAAQADGSGTLTVVGTSDVYDSNLIQSVIQPGFQAAYPDVSLNYVSKGTGAAITYAEAGTASALLVHAASLENQFVDAGYSLDPNGGRAIFYGDYVLLGPASDPAGVMSGGAPSHDIVSAFEKIAAAGADGNANFISRGGTPGTTVQEHAIWALTSGVTTCAVSDANGGGASPSTATGACPANPADYSLPSWYTATGDTQGPNLVDANACTEGGGTDDCYVFTDRGTFEYLQSLNEVPNLQIVTNNNSADAPGGDTLLVNSFHAYAINPAKFTGDPDVQINTTAAQEFLSWITSPAAQTAIGNYLANEPDGAPFLPDAAPSIALSSTPSSVNAGHGFTLTGSIRNIVPGTPPLSGISVKLRSAPTVKPDSVSTVAQATTDSSGNFTFQYTPLSDRRYWVTTPEIDQVENASLEPHFKDVLVGATSPQSAPVKVQAHIKFDRLSAGKHDVTGTALLAPADHLRKGQLKLYGTRSTKAGAKLHFISELPVSIGADSKKFSFFLDSGKWHLQLRYANPGVITTGSTQVRNRTVG